MLDCDLHGFSPHTGTSHVYSKCLFINTIATGKDKSVFVTKEDASKTEMVKELVEEDIHGVVLPNGDINWDCPCLGSLPHGPCGEEFKAAFSCFHFR